MSYRYALLLSLLLTAIVGVVTITLCWSPRTNSGTTTALTEAPFEIPADIAPTDFDANQWRTRRYDNNRAGMVENLLQTYEFRGWARSDVVALLGPGEVGGRSECETYILMQLGFGNSVHGCLRIAFDHQNVATKYDLVVVHLPI